MGRSRRRVVSGLWDGVRKWGGGAAGAERAAPPRQIRRTLLAVRRTAERSPRGAQPGCTCSWPQFSLWARASAPCAQLGGGSQLHPCPSPFLRTHPCPSFHTHTVPNKHPRPAPHLCQVRQVAAVCLLRCALRGVRIGRRPGACAGMREGGCGRWAPAAPLDFPAGKPLPHTTKCRKCRGQSRQAQA